MDYASTASGSYEGKPLLLLTPSPDQDHPDTQNQLIWSLMDLLNTQEIEGVPFDKENPASYNRVRLAIEQMIAESASVPATLDEVRTGTNDTKFVTPLGAGAAAGNYSCYVSIATTPVVFDADDAKNLMGGFIIASATAAAVTLPLLANVPRIGAAYTFKNLAAANVTLSRASTNTILGLSTGNTAVVLRPGNEVTLVKISSTQWAAIGDYINNAPFQKEFVGNWNAYQANPSESGFIQSNYDFAHTLGVMPKMMLMEMQRLPYASPGNGWVSGDTFEIPLQQVANPSAGVMGYATKKTTARLYISFDTNHGLLLKEWNNSGQFRPNNLTWLWRLKAYA